MLFFFTLFLAFLYFKIARVEYKEEKHTGLMHIRNMLFAIEFVALFAYGFLHYSWYEIVGGAYLFFIAAALIVSAVQVGVFIDGKPFVKLTHLRKSLWSIVVILLLSEIYFLASPQ